MCTEREAAAAPVMRPAAAEVSPVPWTRLSAEQRSALGPLEQDWATIDGVRQQKWLQMAARMPALPADERTRIQQRMAQWSQLTPEKRNQARLQFLEAQKLPAPQRQARWQEYQALSAEEKSALARQEKVQRNSGGHHSDRASGKPGARPEAKSESKQTAAKSNLVQVPAPSTSKAATTTALQAKPGATTRPLTTPATPPAHNQPGLPKIAATEGFVDPATLLPKRGPQGAAMRSALSSDTKPKP